MEFTKTFGEAKRLAATLADNDGIKYGVITPNGMDYMVVSEHTSWFKAAEVIDPDSLVAVVYPGESQEDIYKRALEQIAYPENYPAQLPAGAESIEDYRFRLKEWMRSTAVNALEGKQ